MMKTILLIEDNDDIRENTAEILELANYKVLTAENGKTGVELALEHQPDLVVCDIMMPVLDGYGVLHLLQKNPDVQDTPFIFLTAKSERGDFRKGMEMGADDYITKPFSGTDLLNAVERRLKKAAVKKLELTSDMEGLQQLLTSATGTNTLQTLMEEGNTDRFKKKQLIYQEGNRPTSLYYIQKGRVKTYKVNNDGKELAANLYSTGDFLGYVALLEGSNYHENAEALDDCELTAIPREDFETLINNNREVAQQFIRLLAKNITEKEQQLLHIAYSSLRKKVAEALLFLKKKYHVAKDQPFSIDISRENLATIAGTATESMIRTLGDFRDEKLLEIKQGVITILNEQKLANLVN
ncbi:response regulator [Chitinophaga silvisoli]|nr:response regulator [Chitinophaga silvisoli]